jgi:signal transduction histidine kinase
MSTGNPTKALNRLVQLLIDGADELVLDRIVLETVSSLDVSRSLALWRVGPDGELRGGLQVGEDRDLPSKSDIRAHLSGARRLEGDPFVLAVGDDEPLVLALGGITNAAEISAARTLLELCTHTAKATPLELADEVPAALPAEPDDAGTRKLAHDLRNHLMGLRTTCDVLDILADELADEERFHYGEVVVRECRRAGELLAGLIDSNAPHGRGSGTELVEALNDTVDLERAGGAGTAPRLESFVEPAVAEGTYRITAVELGRLVRNLVVNAREAGARYIRVECVTDKTPRGGLVLSVRDDGTGIAPEVAARLFDAGATTKQARTADAHGGWGLATVRELVERAGGSVSAVNLPGRGARLDVWVPFRDRP